MVVVDTPFGNKDDFPATARHVASMLVVPSKLTTADTPDLIGGGGVGVAVVVTAAAAADVSPAARGTFGWLPAAAPLRPLPGGPPGAAADADVGGNVSGGTAACCVAAGAAVAGASPPTVAVPGRRAPGAPPPAASARKPKDGPCTAPL